MKQLKSTIKLCLVIVMLLCQTTKSILNVHAEADTEAPVIDVSSLKVDKTEAISGDKVTISMSISDNIAVNHATIEFENPQTGKSTTAFNQLTYNSTTGLYEYVFNVTDETESGIWQIYEIYATDTSDNYSFIYNSNAITFSTTADLNKGNFRVFASQADLDEYNTYQKVSSVSGATAFYANATVSNKTIDGDVWIGPNALVTLSNVIVTGNIYVLGGLKAQSVTANEIFAHEFLYFSSGNYTYSNGTVSLSGTCSISSLKASTYPVDSIPISIQSELTSLDDVLELKGSTLGVAGFSIDGESVSLYDNEKFIKTINVAGRDKITFSWKTVFGNTITKEYSIDKLYTAPNGKKSHYSQISTTSSINLIIGQPYDLAKYITVTDQEDGENEYKSIDIDSSAIHIDKVGSYTITVKVTDQDNLVSTKELTVNVMQPVASVSLNKASLTLIKGTSDVLTATVSPSDSSNKNVTWSSSDETIATVDQTGKVTALKAGTTTITATTEDGRKTAACNVTVTQPVTGISLNKTDLTMTNGSIEVLTATVEPEDSSNNNVTWSSSDPTVAKVDQSGKVTALKAGTTTITVTTEDGNETATCHVTVTQPVTNISLNKTDLTLTNGDTETLVATVAPENASNKNITWSSGDNTVATVDQTGKVTALKAGTATITATTEDGGKAATCTVKVNQPVTGAEIGYGSSEIGVGDSASFGGHVLPFDATNQKISWKSSDDSIVSIDNEGVATAHKVGTVTLTLTTEESGYTATCTVTVIQPVTGISLNKSIMTLIKGGTETLTASIAPENTSNKNVTWSSSDESVAKVNQTGKVTAIKAGTAVITVTTEDAKKTATCNVTVTKPTPTPAPSVAKQEMYRLYNPNSGEHFYTKDSYERDQLASIGWVYEGVGWIAPATSNTPVYRMYNPNAGEHHYTTNAGEKDMLTANGWNYEGIGWYSDDAQGVPLYRQYNPNAFSCNHNYTVNKSENDWLVSLGWNAEGIGWYGVK